MSNLTGTQATIYGLERIDAYFTKLDNSQTVATFGQKLLGWLAIIYLYLHIPIIYVYVFVMCVRGKEKEI